jgi:hypothetical protein
MDRQDIQLLIEMLGKLDDNQAKAGADRRAWRVEMAAWQEKVDAETEAIRRETVAIRAETKAWRDEMAAMRDKRMEEDRPAAREDAVPERQKLDTVEGSTPSQTKESTRPGWEEPVVEAPASLARMNEERMKVRQWDQQILDHGSARGEHSGRSGADGRKAKHRRKGVGNTRKMSTLGNEIKEIPLGCLGTNNL